jgi:hypothetical protein
MVPPLMTHAYIDEHDLVSRYAMNKLSAEEQADFEAHLIDCVECLDRLDQATALRDGLRKVAASDAVPSVAVRAGAVLPYAPPADAAIGPVRPARRAARQGWVWSLPLGLAAAAVLLIAAVAGVATIVPMRRQLARVTTAAAEWQRRYDEAGRTAGALQERLAAAERELAQRPPAPAIEASVPVFALGIVRSGGGSPPAQISIPASAPLVVLSMELPGATGFLQYRAVLTNAAGQPVWRADQLRPTSPETLGIGLSARLMPPADYLLTLQGIGRQGRTVPLSHYRFRVTSSR